MKNPALWILGLFVLSIPSESGVAVAGVGSLSRLLGIAAFAVGVLSLWERGRLRVRPPSLFLAVAAVFVLWAFATYFWSLAPDRTIVRTSQFIQLFVFAWLVHQYASCDRKRDFLLQAFVVGCYVMISVALVAFFSDARGGYRDVGFGPNSFAGVAAIAIPMAWGLMLRRTYPWLQALNAAYPVFALAAVVLAASRGGLFTALVALTIIPLTLPQLSTVRRLVLFGAVASVAWAAFTLTPQAVPDLERNLERLARADEDLLDGTMTNRTMIWAAGAEVFATSPIVGVGVGAFARAVEPIYGRAVGAHNAFWSVAVTAGIVGLMLFAGMFMVTFTGVMVNPDRRTEYLVLLAALLVTMMPSNYESNKFVWFILALLSSARPIMLHYGARAPTVPIAAHPDHAPQGVAKVGLQTRS